MKVIDLQNIERVKKEPDKKIDIISSGDFTEQDLSYKKSNLDNMLKRPMKN